MYNENPDVFDEVTGQSATAQICDRVALYGAMPPADEEDPRDLPDLAETDGVITHTFEMWYTMLEDSCLDSQRDDLLWQLVNVFQRKMDRLDKGFDQLACEIRRSLREQDGSEIKSTELEKLQIRSHNTCNARRAFEQMRDHAATCYLTFTGHPWMPAYGSRVSQNTDMQTASMIDSRQFLREAARRRSESFLPKGTRIAIAGGMDFNDYQHIYCKLDQVHTKYPDMVLIHGGATKGVDLIASRWAEARKVSQVLFKPDWKRHKKRAGFLRNDEIIAAEPKGLLMFPGSGVTENLADKARKAGVPVYRCS